MDFTLTEEQQLIVKSTREFVERELYPHEQEVEQSDELRPELLRELQDAIGAQYGKKDPFDFVKASLPDDGDAFFQDGIVPDIPYLGKDIVINLEAAHRTLPATFWFSLVSRKVEIAPLNIAFCYCSYRITSTTAVQS